MTAHSTLTILVSMALLAGCSGISGTTVMGDQSAKTVATGSAGGANADNVNAQLQRCDETLGTLTVVEDEGNWAGLRVYNLQSPMPVLRLLIQQSNCFVVVERGRALNYMEQERRLRNSGEMREGSNFGKGQIVAADYTMTPSVIVSNNDAGAIRGALSGLPGVFGTVGQIAGGLKFREASTLLTMIDNRSGVQLAAAEGSSKSTDYGVWGSVFGGGAGAGLGGYTKTPEGKVIAAALADSYNQMVQAVKNYRAQTVQGGLGTGGRLGVQGGQTPASTR